jgi:hypothetical protein
MGLRNYPKLTNQVQNAAIAAFKARGITPTKVCSCKSEGTIGAMLVLRAPPEMGTGAYRWLIHAACKNCGAGTVYDAMYLLGEEELQKVAGGPVTGDENEPR